MFRDTELYKHAQRELDLLLEDEYNRNKSRSVGELEEDFEKFGGMTPQEFINKEVLKVIEVIDPSIHTTKSILHVLDLVYRLVQLENLLPLTLNESEFIEVLGGDEPLYQNSRNIKVFKTPSRGVYHLDGREALDLSTGKFGIVENVESPSEKQLSIFDYNDDGSIKD